MEEKKEPQCGKCIWWDRSKAFDNERKWCMCMNPKSKGFKMWREYKNNLCRSGFESAETE